MSERAGFTTKAILEGNDKLTRFYTGLPTFNSFIAFVTYLEPKAMELRPWKEPQQLIIEQRMSAERLTSSLITEVVPAGVG